jgi:hypothetical protein
MSVYPNTATAPRKRTGLAVGIAVLVAACVAAAGLALSHGSGTTTPSASGQAAQATSHEVTLMRLTPGQIAGGALGGYALPTAQGPSLQQVLASMSPQTRRYTERIMSLTFQQLAAGAAGHP